MQGVEPFAPPRHSTVFPPPLPPMIFSARDLALVDEFLGEETRRLEYRAAAESAYVLMWRDTRKMSTTSATGRDVHHFGTLTCRPVLKTGDEEIPGFSFRPGYFKHHRCCTITDMPFRKSYFSRMQWVSGSRVSLSLFIDDCRRFMPVKLKDTIAATRNVDVISLNILMYSSNVAAFGIERDI